MAHDDVTLEGTARKLLKKINEFGNPNRISSANVNATTLKFAEKFDNRFSHVFLFVTYLLGVIVSTL